ncbi:MAG: hypothetical protein QOJ65_2361 [Fimbriimonadaceae bacterium]|jgi:hypothetical protein|nr:hypothetical protein [Fimbriimonadaceae bacterium]
MDLTQLLNQVKQAIFNDPSTPHQQGHDPTGLIGQIEGLFGNQQTGIQQQNTYARQPIMRQQGNYAYADPAYGNARPASEDPLGDPADQQQFGNIRPASEDPLGDPADR